MPQKMNIMTKFGEKSQAPLLLLKRFVMLHLDYMSPLECNFQFIWRIDLFFIII